MASRVQVALITHQHLFTGIVTTGGSRLLDVLNDSHAVYLPLDDVRFYRVGDAQNPCTVFTEGLAYVMSVNLAILRAREHEAPAKRQLAYVPKKPYSVFLTVPGYEIRGQLHLAYTSSEPDLESFLLRDAGAFFPVTDATVTASSGEPIVQNGPVVFVRRSSLGLMCQGEMPGG